MSDVILSRESFWNTLAAVELAQAGEPTTENMNALGVHDAALRAQVVALTEERDAARGALVMRPSYNALAERVAALEARLRELTESMFEPGERFDAHRRALALLEGTEPAAVNGE